MDGALAGAVAGAAATAPMTAVMTLLRREFSDARREEIPPRQITRRIAQTAGVEPQLDAEQVHAATYFAHVGYGATTGALYPAFAARVRGPTVVKGALFGLAVWGASYLGWLPALRILRPATREPAGRNTMMIAAHLVWGASTALLTGALDRPATPPRL